MNRETLTRLLEDRAAKRPVVLATSLTNQTQKLLYPTENNDQSWLTETAAGVLRSDKSAVVQGPDGDWFLNAYNPPLRMILVGAVHIAQPLAAMAALADYDVIVVDPRTSFASDARFPGVALDTRWPDEALAGLGLNARTALVTLTHDPKLDDPALDAALKSACFYIGALGSKKTHAARRERLHALGHDDAAIGRIHGPVGLAIGAKSPAEIALSIMAEITESLRT